MAKKYYVMRASNKDTEHVFSGDAPRQAALKAATRGFSDIRLRERGRRNSDRTYSVHIFKGSRNKVSAPENRPDWLPAKVWRPNVKKVRVDRIQRL